MSNRATARRNPVLHAAVWSILLVALLSAVVGILVTGQSSHIAAFQQALERSTEARSQVKTVFSTLQDAETGQRGFILTGDPEFLEPYDTAVQVLPGQLETLRGLSAGNAAFEAPLARLERAAGAKLKDLKRSIDARKRDGAEAATAIVSTKTGKRLMDEIRAVVDTMLAAEAQEVSNRSRELRSRVSTFEAISAALLAGVVIVVMLATFLVLAHLERRRKAQDALVRQEKRGAAMQRIAQVVNEAGRFSDALEKVVVVFGEIVGATEGRASMVGRHGEEGSLDLAFQWDAAGSAPRVLAGPSIEPGFPGTTPTLATGEGCWTLCIPVLDGEEPVAILVWRGTDFTTLNGLEDLDSYAAGQLSRAAERQGIRDRLDEALQRQRAIFESAIDAIITVNESGSIESFNGAAERLFGYEAATVIRRNVGILFPKGAGGGLGSDAFRPMLESLGRVGEMEGRHRDGTVFPADIALSEFRLGGRRLVVAIVRDLSERKRIDRMKTEFVSTVSHELRTPLTSIGGSLGLLAGGAAGALPAPAKRLIDIARNNCDRLVRLINDILDLDKIESGKMRFETKPTSLRALVQTAIEANRGFANEFGVGLELAAPDEDLFAPVDPDRMMQALTNLLSNGIKFSPKGDVVTVTLGLAADGARIAVRDRGPGIPEDFRPRMFTKFAQADSSDTRERGGTGLGLSIGKEIVERHGGEISFETQAGWGTEFFIDLPIGGEPKRPEGVGPAGPVEAADVGQPGNGTLLGAPTAKERLTAMVRRAADQAAGRRLLVLHVDDDPDVLQVVQESLSVGADIISVPSVSAARRALREWPVDLVILDLMLAEGSGLELLPALRVDGQRLTPVVIFSAQDADQTTTETVDAILTKSQASLSQLVDAVAELATETYPTPHERRLQA